MDGQMGGMTDGQTDGWMISRTTIRQIRQTDRQRDRIEK